MNRGDWYAHYSEQRIEAAKRRPPVSYVAVLKELYDFMLDPGDQAVYELICRYQKKVSRRLIREKERLSKKGEEQGRRRMAKLVYKENPFLKMIAKDSLEAQ